MITKIYHKDLTAGMFFGFYRDTFELLEIRDAKMRPDDWFKPGMPKVELYAMAWDCTVEPEGYDYFIEVELLTEPYPMIVPLGVNE